MNTIIYRANAQKMPQIAVIQAFEQQRYACLIKNDTFCLKNLIADDLVYTHSNATVARPTPFCSRSAWRCCSILFWENK